MQEPASIGIDPTKVEEPVHRGLAEGVGGWHGLVRRCRPHPNVFGPRSPGPCAWHKRLSQARLSLPVTN